MNRRKKADGYRQAAYGSPGFSLTEMLMGMMVAVILLGMAIPSYRGHVLKADQAEARSALIQNNHFLQRWYLLHGSYRENSAKWPDLPVRRTRSYEIQFGGQAKNTEEGLFQLKAVPRPGSIAESGPELVLDQDGNIRSCRKSEEGRELCWL